VSALLAARPFLRDLPQVLTMSPSNRGEESAVTATTRLRLSSN